MGNTMESAVITTLVQAGAVGISVALIFLIWKISDKCSDNARLITEVVADNAKALTHLTYSVEANTKMTNEMANGIKNMTEMARAAMKMTPKTL